MIPRPVRLAALLALVVPTALALAACNGPTPADLFVVQRTGSIAGARLTMRVVDDGAVYCNRDTRRHPISSDQLIRARALAHLLDGDQDKDKEGLDQEHLHLKPGAISTLSYSIRSEEGTVSFSDTSPKQPQAFYDLAALTRELAKGPCGLAR
jgi:hypothetical protein